MEERRKGENRIFLMSIVEKKRKRKRKKKKKYLLTYFDNRHNSCEFVFPEKVKSVKMRRKKSFFISYI